MSGLLAVAVLALEAGPIHNLQIRHFNYLSDLAEVVLFGFRILLSRHLGVMQLGILDEMAERRIVYCQNVDIHRKRT